MLGNYPNLELLVYIARQCISENDECKKVIQELKEKEKYVFFECIVDVFSQTWGSTSLGFGGIGGATMTTAYTTVVHETATDSYVVFFDTRLAYLITHATDQFYKDLSARRMASVAEARRIY